MTFAYLAARHIAGDAARPDDAAARRPEERQPG
jgi:hypothetical protein